MRTNILPALTLAFVALVFASQSVEATSLATTGHALNNGAGPSGGVWQGSQGYSATPFFSSDTLDAEVEYAVFAPGNFQNFLDENGIVFVDPAPSEYIYAYQIVDIAAGTTPVTTFTVGMNGNESTGITGGTFISQTEDYGTYPFVPSQNPGAAGGGPGVSTSAFWPSVPGSPFTPGEVTPILFYSSPEVPELGLSTVNAGLAGQFLPNSLPNPVPEPATVTLALLSAFCISSRRRLF